MTPQCLFMLLILLLPATPALAEALSRVVPARYRVTDIPAVSFSNSSRLHELTRAGHLYLSIQDAIALAVENNLDIELQRYLPRIARTDFIRASGGGLPRGINVVVNQLPAGIGGPNSPLLINLNSNSAPSPLALTSSASLSPTAQPQSTNLSVTGTTPLSSGPVVPQFDPILGGQLNWSHQSTPQTNTIITGSNWLVTRTLTSNLGWQQGFATGTALNVTFDANHQDANARSYTLAPYTTSSFGLIVVQPLLQGFGRSLNTRYIRIARNNQRVSELVFRQQLIDTVSGVLRLYYDLASLHEDVQVKRESLALAERLLKDNQDKVEQGVLAPVEVTRAQAQLSSARQALIASQGLVKQQELILKTVLTRRGLRDPEIRKLAIIPTSSISVPVGEEPASPIPDLLTEAAANRPDLLQAGLQIENERAALEGSRNGVRPQLNLVGVVQNNGLAGSPNTAAAVADPASLGGFADTLGQIVRRNHPSYAIGLQVNLPLRNRVAQADLARDELQARQSEIRRQQLEDSVRLEVENAVIAVEQARAALRAAVDARVLQGQSAEIEREKYASGLSTTFLVIQYQTAFAQARSTEIAAKGEYAKANVALDRALGRTLGSHNIEWKP